MGMAASQARYLSLLARESNLEYQGQQINQERTVLSQQTANLYNSLLEMTVPTPPSTSDYTKVTYKGTLDASVIEIPSNKIKPNKDKTFTVTIQNHVYDGGLAKNSGWRVVEQGDVQKVGIRVELSASNPMTKPLIYKKGDGITETTAYAPAPSNVSTTQAMKPDTAGKYVFFNGQYKEIEALKSNGETIPADAQKFSPCTYDPKNSTHQPVINYLPQLTTVSDAKLLYVFDGTGALKPAIEGTDYVTSAGNIYPKEGKQYFYETSSGSDSATLSNEGTSGYKVSGYQTYTLQDALGANMITQEQYWGYCSAITNTFSFNDETKNKTAADFYIYFDSDNTAHFALIDSVQSDNQATVTYDYEPNSKVVKDTEYKNCKLTFDPSNGMVCSIDIPEYDAVGNLTGRYTTIDLTAETVTDNDAYNDAYSQYEYETYLYDKKNEEINAKTEIIQQEDRNLELKLQRLDTERQTIEKEHEAVKSVLKANIDKCYNVFSG